MAHVIRVSCKEYLALRSAKIRASENIIKSQIESQFLPDTQMYLPFVGNQKWPSTAPEVYSLTIYKEKKESHVPKSSTKVYHILMSWVHF